jgi:outer membrane receptor protein involved in Fe transport
LKNFFKNSPAMMKSASLYSRLLKQYIKILLMPVVLLFSLFTAAQTSTVITGKVTGSNGAPLPGVSVNLRNSTSGTQTDSSGNYSLSVSSLTGTLVFTYVGLTPQEISISNRATIDLVMQNNATDLGEVVVVGYGTQRKKDLTGAISVVSAKDIQKRQVTTVGEALQGLATGVNVRGGGLPGSEARVQIRGLKNVRDANPLYVIDGLITTGNRDLYPNDIE